MSEEIKVQSFHVKYYGDPSVGIPDVNWSLTGGFIFQDAEDLERFRLKLQESFQAHLDEPVSIQTDAEILKEHEWEIEAQKHLNKAEDFPVFGEMDDVLLLSEDEIEELERAAVRCEENQYKKTIEP